jgi:hypothetical protein
MSPTTSLRRAAGAVLAAAACAGLAACGGDDAPATSGAASASEQDAAQVRLRDCLREQGVDLPAPGEDGGSRIRLGNEQDRRRLDEAFQACDEERKAAFGDVTQEDRQELQDDFARFAQCMRDRGVEVPDVQFGSGAPRADGAADIDPDDPDVRAARDACQDKLPQGLPGGGR